MLCPAPTLLIEFIVLTPLNATIHCCSPKPIERLQPRPTSKQLLLQVDVRALLEEVVNLESHPMIISQASTQHPTTNRHSPWLTNPGMKSLATTHA